MNIVIIGLGTIGKTILHSLKGERHNITIIDDDKGKIEELIERYDVLGIVGNGAEMNIQKEANVGEADLVIALTRSDELNILACLVAKKIGAQNTIARVRNPNYRKQIALMKDDLGLAMVVNPEFEAAKEIFHMIDLPSVGQIEYFAKGRVSLVEVVAEQDCALVGETLITLSQKIETKVLVCAVQRKDEVIIPTGDFKIEAGDRIHFTANAQSLGSFLSEVGLEKSSFRNVMIVGGSRIGYYLADILSREKYAVKLLECDSATAEDLAQALPRVTVVCGNGTSHTVLIEEGIEDMDAFVALTDIDEENMIASMFASKKKVRKSIAKIKNDDLYGLIGELAIHNSVSPKHVVAGRIISYIRALSNTVGSKVLTLYQLVNNQVEALEFATVRQESFYDRPLRELNMKKDCLIACIIRQNRVIIPDGSTEIHLGDNVVVVTTHKNFDDLRDVIE